jgi:chemotaxis signal transduction protein
MVMPLDNASEPQDPSGQSLAMQYLTYHLGDESFAMDIRAVREIIQYSAKWSL